VNWESVIPKAIPTKRMALTVKKPVIHPTYTERLEDDKNKGSKMYREKIEADRKRLGLK
jgi:hypothetical protein